jgi:hypothetical protein
MSGESNGNGKNGTHSRWVVAVGGMAIIGAAVIGVNSVVSRAVGADECCTGAQREIAVHAQKIGTVEKRMDKQETAAELIAAEQARQGRTLERHTVILEAIARDRGLRVPPEER